MQKSLFAIYRHLRAPVPLFLLGIGLLIEPAQAIVVLPVAPVPVNDGTKEQHRAALQRRASTYTRHEESVFREAAQEVKTAPLAIEFQATVHEVAKRKIVDQLVETQEQLEAAITNSDPSSPRYFEKKDQLQEIRQQLLVLRKTQTLPVNPARLQDGAYTEWFTYADDEAETRLEEIADEMVSLFQGLDRHFKENQAATADLQLSQIYLTPVLDLLRSKPSLLELSQLFAEGGHLDQFAFEGNFLHEPHQATTLLARQLQTFSSHVQELWVEHQANQIEARKLKNGNDTESKLAVFVAEGVETGPEYALALKTLTHQIELHRRRLEEAVQKTTPNALENLVLYDKLDKLFSKAIRIAFAHPDETGTGSKEDRRSRKLFQITSTGAGGITGTAMTVIAGKIALLLSPPVVVAGAIIGGGIGYGINRWAQNKSDRLYRDDLLKGFARLEHLIEHLESRHGIYLVNWKSSPSEWLNGLTRSAMGHPNDECEFLLT